MIIGTTRLYILLSVWMTLTFVQGHTCTRNKKNLSVHLFANLGIDFDEIQYVAITFWFVEAHAKYIVQI